MQPTPLHLDSFRQWLTEHKIEHFYSQDLNQFALPVPGRPDLTVRAVPRAERSMFTFALVLPFRVPRERYDAYVKALSLANSATYMGSFVLHHGTGESWMQITVPTSDILYTDAGLAFVVRALVLTADAVAPGLRRVAEGGPPEEVLPADQLPPGSV